MDVFLSLYLVVELIKNIFLGVHFRNVKHFMPLPVIKTACCLGDVMQNDQQVFVVTVVVTSYHMIIFQSMFKERNETV